MLPQMLRHQGPMKGISISASRDACPSPVEGAAAGFGVEHRAEVIAALAGIGKESADLADEIGRAFDSPEQI